MGAPCPSSLLKWVFAVLQDFTTAFCLGCNLMVRPGGMQLFYDRWDNGCDVGLYHGVAEAGLEPVPLVVVLGLWGIPPRNLPRRNLFMQISLVLFTPRLPGPSHCSAWLCLHLFTEQRQDLALAHLLQRHSHPLSLDSPSSKDITWQCSTSFLCSSFYFGQIRISR